MHINVMQRVKRDNKEQQAKVLFSYDADCIPKKGELLDFTKYVTYIVVAVIYCGKQVILEVEEYKDLTNPTISHLPLF